MSDQFMGEIRMVGFGFAPSGWFTCQGQLLSINQYTALFALLGTTFGGNGVSTFQLPDLQGRSPLGQGSGLGLPTYVWGEEGGTPTTTLALSQLPLHTHSATFAGTSGGSAPVTATVNCSPSPGGSPKPDGNYRAGQAGTNEKLYVPPAEAGNPAAIAGVTGGSVAIPAAAGTVTLQNTGGSQPVSIEPPFLCLYFIIAWQGIFPSRG